MNDIIKAGFTNAKDRETYDRIIMSVSGLEKQGKTHFALSAPGPISLFSTDIGEEGVVGKFLGKKTIYVMDVARIDEDSATEAPAEWDKFKKAYNHCLRSKSIRSIVVDTATEIWELLRMARFGRLTQVMPYQYGPVNAEFRTLIREAYKFDKNVILLHKMKAQYINDKRTGEWERAGFSDMGFLVQVNAQVYRYDPSEGGAFCCWIRDCRQNESLAGEIFEGELCSFPMIATMVLPGTDPSVWE